MSISLCFTPLVSNPKTHPKFPAFRPLNPVLYPNQNLFSRRTLSPVKCVQREDYDSQSVVSFRAKPRWENVLSTAASIYPVYVTVGGIVACLKPSTFSWFVKRGPLSYSVSLGFIMLVMGLTLELKDLTNLFLQRPFSILFGCAAQYTIMPALGVIISKFFGLSPSASVGLVLLACCPGGTASNVVTLIALGDVPLSIVMTVCTTLGAVVLTPLLTKILAGTYVPVDAVKLSVSTLQVVVAPILLGSSMQSLFPGAVKSVTPFAPLLAVLACSLLACRLFYSILNIQAAIVVLFYTTCLLLSFFSVFSENVLRLKSSIVGASLATDLPPLHLVKAVLCSELGVVIGSVVMLHFAGFFLGYLSAAIGGFEEPQRRAMSIEVGMQNSSLGVVLASSHFSSPEIALPAAISAVVMNIMGSSLGFIWRYIHPTHSKTKPCDP